MPQLSVPFDREFSAGTGQATELAGRLRESLSSPLRAAAFWAAVVLPFLHLPLLLSGLETGPEVLAFVLLLVLNGLAVVVGHSHHRD